MKIAFVPNAFILKIYDDDHQKAFNLIMNETNSNQVEFHKEGYQCDCRQCPYSDDKPAHFVIINPEVTMSHIKKAILHNKSIVFTILDECSHTNRIGTNWTTANTFATTSPVWIAD